MTIDINELRDYKGGNPDLWREYMRKRYKDPEIITQILALDAEWRPLTDCIGQMRKQVNQLQRDVIACKMKNGEDCKPELAQKDKMQANIQCMEATLRQTAQQRDALLHRIPNMVDPQVPVSQDEDADNVVVAVFPLPPELRLNKITLPCPLRTLEYTLPTKSGGNELLTHDELLYRIGGYEAERGRKVGGNRAYFLTNAGVLLNQALINYGLTFLMQRGYNQVLQPPYLMKKEVMAQIAQLEDFDEQLYKVTTGKTDADADDDDDNDNDKYLIATSEQPICAYHKDERLEPSQLPLRYAGLSTCFRKEAGHAGKDIRGIFRVHQFEKLEQFVLTTNDYTVSQAEQERMLKTAQDFFDSLGIAYRVVSIVSGKLNDAAVKKYDLEGWFPGQGTYRELVSCSNCTDYQSRNVGVRCGNKGFCHMLNSTLCATGRGICCLLETYQTPDGVKVPPVLLPYMGGKDFLPFVRGPPP